MLALESKKPRLRFKSHSASELIHVMLSKVLNVSSLLLPHLQHGVSIGNFNQIMLVKNPGTHYPMSHNSISLFYKPRPRDITHPKKVTN